MAVLLYESSCTTKTETHASTMKRTAKKAAFLYNCRVNLITVSTKCYLQNCFVSSLCHSLEYTSVSFCSGKLIFVWHEGMCSASDYRLKETPHITLHWVKINFLPVGDETISHPCWAVIDLIRLKIISWFISPRAKIKGDLFKYIISHVTQVFLSKGYL